MGAGGGQKVKSEASVPWYQRATGEELYRRGTAEAAKPYTPYTGQRVAPINANQSNAWAATTQNANSWGPLLQQAQDSTALGGQSWIDPGVMDSYIDPYQDAVTDRAARELERNFGIQEKLRRGRSAETGSWGGSQAGVAEASSQRDFMQQLEDLYSTGAEKAYQSGLGAFQGDRAAKQQAGGAYANLAQMLPSLQRADVAAIEEAGNAQRAQEQTGLDQQYSDFTEGRDWNKNQLSWLASLMNQTPSPTSSTQSGGGGADKTGQIAGGVVAAASIAAMVF